MRIKIKKIGLGINIVIKHRIMRFCLELVWLKNQTRDMFRAWDPTEPPFISILCSIMFFNIWDNFCHSLNNRMSGIQLQFFQVQSMTLLLHTRRISNRFVNNLDIFISICNSHYIFGYSDFKVCYKIILPQSEIKSRGVFEF